MGRVVIPGFRKIETNGGGEGGTTNYNDLTNKPSINNVQLVGNLNTVNLKLTDKTLTEEGVPAEAKTVGAKLAEQSSNLNALSGQLGNHTVKSDVPENAVFTDTVYDDTEVKESIEELSSNLSDLAYGDNSGGRNIFQLDKIKCGSMVENDLVLANQGSEFYEYNWKPNTQYTISFVGRNSTSNGAQRLYFEYTDGSTSEPITNNGTSFDYVSATSEVGKTIKSLNSYWGNSGSLIIKDAEIMIEEGTTATPYEPYIPSVKMLAEENEQQNIEAMDLKMLGWTVPRECPIQNYVDSDGVFHQRVGRVDLGNLNWTYSSEYKRFSTIGITDYKNKDSGSNDWVADAFLKGYSTTSGNNTARDGYDKIIGFNGTNNMFFVKNTSYTDTTTFKNAMQGKYLYYELATEISMNVDGNEAVTSIKNDLDKLNSLPIGSIIQIEAAKDNIETTKKKYGWQYLGTSNIECNDGSVKILVTNVYRKNN